MKRNAWWAALAAVLAIAAVVVAALVQPEQTQAQGPPQGPPPPPQVSVVAVEAATVPVTFDFVGTTEASKVVEIRSRVNGFLETREFEEGTIVEAGTRLFTIDPRSFEADRQIALARVEQAKARLRLAEQEVKRLQSVNVPGAIAQSDLDARIAEQTNARAALRLSEAELAKADLELSYTKVEAPITGYIGKAEKEIGSVVDPSANSLLAVMHQLDPIYVSFEVSEREYLRWRTGEAAGAIALAAGEQPYLEISLLNGETYAQRGQIDFESAQLDPGTGTVELRATFSNPNHTLKSGQFVQAHVQGYALPDAVAVPQRAVSQSPQGAYVYVVGADNKAEMRIITPGEWSGQNWIVKEGLKPGETVVVEGLTKVQPGGEVAPVPLGAGQPVAQAGQ